MALSPIGVLAVILTDLNLMHLDFEDIFAVSGLELAEANKARVGRVSKDCYTVVRSDNVARIIRKDGALWKIEGEGVETVFMSTEIGKERVIRNVVSWLAEA
jgi:hypothetical protein